LLCQDIFTADIAVSEHAKTTASGIINTIVAARVVSNPGKTYGSGRS